MKGTSQIQTQMFTLRSSAVVSDIRLQQPLMYLTNFLNSNIEHQCHLRIF